MVLGVVGIVWQLAWLAFMVVLLGLACAFVYRQVAHVTIKRLPSRALLLHRVATVGVSLISLFLTIIVLWPLIELHLRWIPMSTNPFWAHRPLTDMAKSTLLDALPAEFRPWQAIIRTPADLDTLQHQHYPLIFKPDICSTDSRNVSKIHSRSEALAYLQARNLGVSLARQTLAQALAPGEEVSIMYRRFPGQTLPTLVHVGMKRPAGWYASPAGLAIQPGGAYLSPVAGATTSLPLQQTMLRMMSAMSGMHCCRIDAMVPSPAALLKGEGLLVLEVNQGVPATDYLEIPTYLTTTKTGGTRLRTFSMDPTDSLPANTPWQLQQAYARLKLRQVRTFLLEMAVGLANLGLNRGPSLWQTAMAVRFMYHKASDAGCGKVEHREHFIP